MPPSSSIVVLMAFQENTAAQMHGEEETHTTTGKERDGQQHCL
jgi:hypothetical protein